MFKVVSSSPTFGKYSEDPVKTLLSNNCEIKMIDRDITSDEEKFANALKDVDALIVGVEKITPTVLKHATNLKIIAKHGAGVDNIDMVETNKRNIIVANAPGANRHAVADYVFGLLLSVSRNIPSAVQDVKNNKWTTYIGSELYNKTLGVIGTGRIGKEVVKRAQGFNMNVLCFDLYPELKLEAEGNCKYVELEELLRLSDFITLHTDLNANSKSFIGKKELESMKSTAFIINTARGGIIDENALHHALKNNEIMGAALDVFENEPVTSSTLLDLPNFIGTPHIAGYTKEALREVGMITVTNVLNVLQGREPEYKI
ncbi:MAG: phosphoglycerate dehydrogenase [Bacillaceae bacterium]|nr:phosphoglycerate dehydrogenase [Bacillaceae bacterium]